MISENQGIDNSKNPAVKTSTSSGVSDVSKKKKDVSLSQDKSIVSLNIARAVVCSPMENLLFLIFIKCFKIIEFS